MSFPTPCIGTTCGPVSRSSPLKQAGWPSQAGPSLPSHQGCSGPQSPQGVVLGKWNSSKIKSCGRHDYQPILSKPLLEEAVSQCSSAVDASIGVDLQALSHQLPQTLALPQDLIACFHRVDVLPVGQLPLRLRLVDSPVTKQPPQTGRCSLVDHPLREAS